MVNDQVNACSVVIAQQAKEAERLGPKGAWRLGFSNVALRGQDATGVGGEPKSPNNGQQRGTE